MGHIANILYGRTAGGPRQDRMAWRTGGGATYFKYINLKICKSIFSHHPTKSIFSPHTHTTRIRHPSPFRSYQRSRQFKSLDNKKPLGAKTSALIDARAAWERVTRLKWPIWRKQPSQLIWGGTFPNILFWYTQTTKRKKSLITCKLKSSK